MSLRMRLYPSSSIHREAWAAVGVAPRGVFIAEATNSKALHRDLKGLKGFATDEFRRSARS
jgi:hypothetical protein